MLTALGRGWNVPRLPCGYSITGRSCPSARPQLGSGGEAPYSQQVGMVLWARGCGTCPGFQVKCCNHCGTVMCQLVRAGSAGLDVMPVLRP